MVRDNRKGCCTESKKKNDPFIEAWLDRIPPTSSSKAVWEFDRGDQIYKPFMWDGLTMSPRVQCPLIDNLFLQIRNLGGSHPIPATKKILMFVFLFHLPLILISVTLFNIYVRHQSVRRRGITPGLILYLVAILGSSFFLIAWSICTKRSYTAKLKERERDLSRLADHVTQQSLYNAGMKANIGSCCAWVEIEFLHPDLYMINTGNAVLHPPYNTPMTVAAQYNQAKRTPFDP